MSYDYTGYRRFFSHYSREFLIHDIICWPERVRFPTSQAVTDRCIPISTDLTDP
jgi:hypothetical protein